MSEIHFGILGDFVSHVYGGGTPSKQEPDYWDGDIPWASVKDLTSNNPSGTEESITEEGLSSSASRLVPAGTPIVATRMAVGRTAVFERDVAINQDLKAIFVNPSLLDKNYLFQFLLASEQLLASKGTGSTVKGIRLDDLLQLNIAVPSLPEQKKIAEILSGIDHAISTKEEMLAKRERVSELLAVDLLNANKKEEMAFLADIATLYRGKFSHRPRNDPSLYGGDIPFIQTGDIPKKGVRVSEFNQTLNQKGLGVSRLFPKGTLVITIAATIGEVGILDFSACFPDSLVGITPLKERCNPIYLLFALRYFKKDLLQLAPQSAQSNLNLEILGKYPIPLPPMTIQNQIADVVINQEREDDSRQRYIAKLRFLKQAMTENLLSGRKRVSV